ncbi:MAG: condensation domain-containing protein [Oscillospiraceae bacterium]|nr:condensation domain-containing protein [Oscillospiraceae bacterium]
MLTEKERIYKRKLISLEATFINSPGAIVGMVAKISGLIDDNKFKYAIDKIVEAYPILKCKINWDKDDEPYFEETNNSIPVSIIKRYSDEDFENIISEEWEKGFDLVNGPLCKFILLKSPEKSEIIFVGQHSIIDGISTTIMVDLMLKIMDNQSLQIKSMEYEKLPSEENLKKYIPKISLIDRLKNTAISNFVNYRWKRSKINIPKEDIKKAQDCFFNKFFYIVKIDEFSVEQTAAFIFKCKKNNVTVNSALGTAFLACRAEENLDKRIIIPVDLRKYLGDSAKEFIGCYSSSIEIGFTYDVSKSFWENAKIFNELSFKSLTNFEHIKKLYFLSRLPNNFLESYILSQRIQTHQDIFKIFPYAEKLGQNSNNIASIAARAESKKISTFTITNLGIFNRQCDYKNFKLESLIMYPSSVASSSTNIILSVITINSKLTLSYHMLVDKVKKNSTYHYIENIKEKVHKFILDI